MKFVQKLFGNRPKATITSLKESVSAKSGKSASSARPANSANLKSIAEYALSNGNNPYADSDIINAIQALAYSPLLVRIAKQPGRFAKSALENIASKLEQSQLSSDHLKQDQLKQDFSSLAEQLSVIAYCRSEEIANTFIAPVTDESTLLTICETTSSARLRTRLIDKIHTPERLKRLEKQFRSSDKKNTKIIRQKLDVQKQKALASIEAQTKLDTFITELSAHSKRTSHQDFIFRLESFKRKWENLQNEHLVNISEQTRKDVSEYFQKCEETANSIKTEQEEAEKRNKELESASFENADAVDEQQSEETTATSQTTLEAKRPEQTELAERHEQPAVSDTPSADDTARKAELKKNKELDQEITVLIRKARAAVDHGQLKRANGLRHSIEEKLSARESAPAHIERSVASLIEKIHAMGDWQTYAISPKLQALIEDMAELAGQPKNPELQATKIQTLQQQWKSLTHGSGNKHQEQWEIFKAHADIAYAPCKKFYDELDSERTKNTEKRGVLIEQLQSYYQNYNWEQADWGDVEKVLQSAKKEWQSYSPSLRKQQKEQQQQFNEQLTSIQNKLDAWYADNKAAKQQLINGLAPLVESDNLDQAIQTAIEFQKKWKAIGHCKRKDEQALWKAFRASCDTIFAKRQALRDSENAKIDAVISKAESVLEKLDELLKSDNDTFSQQLTSADNQQQEIDVEGLPKSKAIALSKRHRTLTDKIEQRRQQLIHAKRNQSWKDAFDIKQRCVLAATERADIDDSLAEEISEFSKQHGDAAKALNTAILSTAKASDEAADQGQSTPYRHLCIVAEVATDTSTPELDKPARMQYQVEQLQLGLGKTTPSTEKLALQWLATKNRCNEDYSALQSRFLSTLNFAK